MAEYISFQPSDFFNTKLYTGTGSSNAITGVGFSADLTWLKSRSAATSHYVFDTARGATKAVIPDGSDAEATNAEYQKSWESDGFTVGTNTGVNDNTKTYASWNWKMGTTSGLTGGSLTPTAYSINTTAKQGIYAYTGTGATATIPHGLGATPTAIFIKTLAVENWAVYYKSMGNTKYMILNTNGVIQTATTFWNDTSPTDTVFTIKDNVSVNTNLQTYIAYVFCDTPGYFKQGNYTGNGNADGPFIYTGFRPAFVIIKKSSGAGSWWLFDNKRLGYNANNYHLFPDTTGIEGTTAYLDLVSNGFKIRNTDGDINFNGSTITYMAFAEFPLVSSNDVPTVAR